jgi:hypothetical protein
LVYYTAPSSNITFFQQVIGSTPSTNVLYNTSAYFDGLNTDIQLQFKVQDSLGAVIWNPSEIHHYNVVNYTTCSGTKNGPLSWDSTWNNFTKWNYEKFGNNVFQGCVILLQMFSFL